MNRIAIVIKPTELFLDWLNGLPEEEIPFTLEQIHEDCSVYLVPAADEDAALNYLEDNYQEVFETELASWYTDPTLWPTERNLDNFRVWFDLNLHSLVLDLADDDLIMEELDEEEDWEDEDENSSPTTLN